MSHLESRPATPQRMRIEIRSERTKKVLETVDVIAPIGTELSTRISALMTYAEQAHGQPVFIWVKNGGYIVDQVTR